MISKVEHIGIMVSDLDRSIAFYRDVLGLELIERLKNNTAEIAFFKVGDVEIELVAGSSAPYEKTDGIVNHLTFTVTDLDAALQMLKDKGVELINSEPVPIWGGMRVLFFRGPDGEKLEFFERKAPRA
ncbi:MAG: VOC family protein [Limnochordia bacterium]